MKTSDLDRHITGNYGEDQIAEDNRDIREQMLVGTLRRIRRMAMDGNLPAAIACREIAELAAWQLTDLDHEV